MSLPPSVTTVLGCFTDFSRIPPKVLQHACARGTRVHNAIAAHLQGLWVMDLNEEDQLYFNSFRRWADIILDRVLFVEQEIICDCYGYVGHIDAGLILRGEDTTTVIDWKTPITESKTWIGQIAAYSHLVEQHTDNPPVKRGGTVMLSPQGKTAKLKEYTSQLERVRYFNAFIGALQAYKFFK